MIKLGIIVNILTQIVQLYLVILVAGLLEPRDFTLFNQWLFLAGFFAIFFNLRSDFFMVEPPKVDLSKRYLGSLILTIFLIIVSAICVIYAYPDALMLVLYAGALGLMKVITNFFSLKQKYLYFPCARLSMLSSLVILLTISGSADKINVFYTSVFWLFAIVLFLFSLKLLTDKIVAEIKETPVLIPLALKNGCKTIFPALLDSSTLTIPFVIFPLLFDAKELAMFVFVYRFANAPSTVLQSFFTSYVLGNSYHRDRAGGYLKLLRYSFVPLALIALVFLSYIASILIYLILPENIDLNLSVTVLTFLLSCSTIRMVCGSLSAVLTVRREKRFIVRWQYFLFAGVSIMCALQFLANFSLEQFLIIYIIVELMIYLVIPLKIKAYPKCAE